MRFNWNPDPLYIPRQRSAICSSGFYLAHWGYTGSARGLGCEAQFLWLQTKPRPFSLQIYSRCLASLISLLGVSPAPEAIRTKQASSSLLPSLWCHLSICGFLQRYAEASFWWDQAMFGHECGFEKRNVSERQWKLTELNSWGWRADARLN